MTKKSLSINIIGLKIFLRVGVYEWEKKRPRLLRLSINAQLAHAISGESDAVDDTLDYDVVARIIQEYSATADHDLLESFAEVISKKLLDYFEIISALTLTNEKPGALKTAENGAIIYSVER